MTLNQLGQNGRRHRQVIITTTTTSAASVVILSTTMISMVGVLGGLLLQLLLVASSSTSSSLMLVNAFTVTSSVQTSRMTSLTCTGNSNTDHFVPTTVVVGGVLGRSSSRRRRPRRLIVRRMMSDWSDFGSLDDDDEDDLLEEDLLLNDGVPIDRREYATENDTDEVKQQVGATLDPPTIDDAIGIDSDSTDIITPLFVPPQSQLPLDELTVVRVLQACREEIGTLFGYAVENRAVGITGGVDYVGLDGPSVVLRLKGRFWHQRTTVLSRVANYLQQRIPEIIDVTVEDEWQLTDEANDVF